MLVDGVGYCAGLLDVYQMRGVGDGDESRAANAVAQGAGMLDCRCRVLGAGDD
jgi:hypothetical protein